MQFRDLKRQYLVLKNEIDESIKEVIESTNFIAGEQVKELEKALAEYVGVKNCITCANGTDALNVALMAWGIGPGDAVFVPDYTFFATAEVVSYVGATPIFVDVDQDTFNIDARELEKEIKHVIKEGILVPRLIITVDLFGQPAEYKVIRQIALKYGLWILEDGAQGFGGRIEGKKACSFGDISTTSFFPAKPLGCYGDGGAIFTDDEEKAALIRSICVHGKGSDKYDNVRIGCNSRLDTLQAAVLIIKLKAFEDMELQLVNKIAEKYTRELADIVKVPMVKEGYYSSWAQYTIKLCNREMRDKLQKYLKEREIPSMIYYPKAMHALKAFRKEDRMVKKYMVSSELAETVLSLPMGPYLSENEQDNVIFAIKEFMLNM